MKRWSKLQKRLYNLIEPAIDFQIHCSIYRMNSQSGSTNLPRYFITLDREIIWDYPPSADRSACADDASMKLYPYITDISAISDIICEYIDTPKTEVFAKLFENDRWNLIPILKAADRRLGLQKLRELGDTSDACVRGIIRARLKAKSTAGSQR